MANKFAIKKENDNLYEVLLDTAVEGDFLEEKTADTKGEKHVPFIQEVEDGYIVRVGEEVDHPMIEKHYIEFIEIIVDQTMLHRKYLNPGDEPVAHFKVEKGTSVVAREHCNLHGLWVNQK